MQRTNLNYGENYLIFELEWKDNFLNFKDKKNLIIRTSSNVQLRDNINEYDYNQYSNYYFILENFKKDFQWLQSKK